MTPARLVPLLLAAVLGLGSCSAAREAASPEVVAVSPVVASENPIVVTLPDEPVVQAAAAPDDEIAATTPDDSDETDGNDETDEPVESTTPDQPSPPAEDRSVDPLERPLVAVGNDSGPETARAQARLLELGFWVDGITGEYGTTTSQAVLAFQKFYGLETDGVLGPLTAEALGAVTERPSGRATGGTLVEIDKNKQLVFLVAEGSTRWILNASTGSEIAYEEPDQNTPGEIQRGDSVTRTGLFEVNRERPEGWWEGDLGEIYRPKYFDGGIALHGSYNVPDYPASHGCVRLSIPAMDWIWETGVVPKGTPVWVHGEIPDPPGAET